MVDTWLLWFVFIFISCLALHYSLLPKHVKPEEYPLSQIILEDFEAELQNLTSAFDSDTYVLSIKQCLKDSKRLSQGEESRAIKVAEEVSETLAEAKGENDGVVILNTTQSSISAIQLEKTDEITAAQPVEKMKTQESFSDELEKSPKATRKAIDDFSFLQNSAANAFLSGGLSQEEINDADALTGDIAGDEDLDDGSYSEELSIETICNEKPEQHILTQYAQLLPETGYKKIRDLVSKIPAGQRILELFEIYDEHLSETTKSALYLALADYALEPDTSSIVRGPQDDELQEYMTSFDILAKVKLIEHVRNVVLEMTAQFKNFPGIYQRYIGDFYLMAMYHDIGKLAKHRNDAKIAVYRMLDHPVLSAKILQLRAPETREDVIQAISLHHKPTEVVHTKFHDALRKADTEARRLEIRERSEDVPSIHKWLKKERLIQLLSDAYYVYIEEEKNITRPAMLIVHGYLVIKKEYYFDLITKQMAQKGQIFKEQLRSKDAFENATLQALVQEKLITEEVLQSIVALQIRAVGRTRAVRMNNYMAIAVESLGFSTSALPEDIYGKQYTGIQFEKKHSSN
jgi:hypothetical protein